MYRWLPLFLLVANVGCSKGTDTGGDTDTQDTDTSSVDDTDTDVEKTVQWTDRHIQTSSTLYGVYSGGTGAWVVGTAGAIWQLSNGSADPITTHIEEDLQGVWGTGDDTSTSLVAVGTSGTVASYDAGSTELSTDDIGTPTLNDVDGSADDLVAAGWGGIWENTGDGWQFEDVGAAYRLAGVRASGSTDIAVGDGGVVLMRTGSGDWGPVDSGVDADLHAVAGTADNEVWAVGGEGTILHWDGGTWTKIDAKTTTTLWGVWEADDGKVFVVGNNGLALMGDENGFSEIYSGTDANLYAVYGTSSTSVWAVGNRGTVLRYTGPQ